MRFETFVSLIHISNRTTLNLLFGCEAEQSHISHLISTYSKFAEMHNSFSAVHQFDLIDHLVHHRPTSSVCLK